MKKILISLLLSISSCIPALANTQTPAKDITTNTSAYTKNLNGSSINQQLVDNTVDQLNVIATSPTQCNSGKFPSGIDTSGNAINCQDVPSGGSSLWAESPGNVGINTFQNVGIGTISPDWPLTVTNTHLLDNSNLVIGVSTVIPFDGGTGIQGFGFSAIGSHGASDTVGIEGASYQNTDNSGFEGTVLYDDAGSFAGGFVYGNLTNPFISGYTGIIYKNDLSILTPSGGSQTTFDSTGNVGIGSFVPIGNLDVESNPMGNATICLNGSCVTSLSGGGGTNLWQVSPGNFGINTTQQVSIGTINPVDKLTVVTSMATTSSGITVQNKDSTGETGITLKDDSGVNQGTISYSNSSTANIPAATLVLGNNNGYDYINQNGSIGIGTTTPQAAIHAWLGGSGSHLRFDITDINVVGTESYDLTSGTDSRVATLEHDNSSSSDPYPDATVLASFSGPLNLTTSYGTPNSGIIVAANGNVGVGTSLPNTSFQVIGTTDVTQNIFSGPITTMPFDGTYSYAFHGFGINNVSPNSLDGSAFQNNDASGGAGVGIYDNNNNLSLALLHGNSASTLSGLPANSNVLRFTTPFTIASFNGSGVGQYFGVDNNVSFLSGNVGIGTNNPQSTLSIFGSTSSALHPPSVNLQNGNSAGFTAITFADESGTLSGDMALTNTSYSALPKTLFIGAFNNDSLMLSSNGASSPAIYIPASTSNVGIGTTIPADWLQINNNGGQNGITLQSSNSAEISLVDGSNTQRGSLGMSFTGGGQAQFETNNGQTIRITTNGAGGGSDPSGITLVGGGNIGIGTLNPQTDLDINGPYVGGKGNININSNIGDFAGISFSVGGVNLGNFVASDFGSGTLEFDNEGKGNTYFSAAGGGGDFIFNGSVESITAKYNGNVGIGTRQPSTRLQVVGDTYSTGDTFTGASSTPLYIAAGFSQTNGYQAVKNVPNGIVGGQFQNTDSSGGEGMVFYDDGGNLAAFNGRTNSSFSPPNTYFIGSMGDIGLSTNFGGGTTFSMMVKPSGNVGIGTVNPAYSLEVKAANGIGFTGGNNVYISGTDNDCIKFGVHTRQGWCNATNNDPSGSDFYALTNNVEAMRITASGNVGIGTALPSALLDVKGTARATTLNVTGLTASKPVFTDTSKNLVSNSNAVSQIVASGNSLANSATVASVATYTTPNDSTVHSFRVGAYTAITAISAGTLTITATFTDQNSNSQTVTYFPMGLTSAGLTTTGFTPFESANIRCKANTAITIVATFTGVSITYDVGGTIEQLY